MKNLQFPLIILLVLCHTCFSQTNNGFAKNLEDTIKFTKSANSGMSALSRDVFVKYFQIAANNIFGESRSITFNTSPYTLITELNPKLKNSRSYKDLSWLRKTNITAGLKLNENFSFNGFTSELKFALIDKTDPSTNNLFSEWLSKDSFRVSIDLLRTKINQSLRKITDPVATANIDSSKVQFLYRKSISFAETSDEFKNLVDSIFTDDNDPKLNEIKNWILKNRTELVSTAIKDRNSKYKDMLKKNSLWVIGINDSTYKDKFKFSSISVFSQFTKGISRPNTGSNWEINISSILSYVSDSTLAERNLKRVVFEAKPLLNYVLRDKENNYSLLEFALGASYVHRFMGKYIGEEKNTLYADAVLRIRLKDDIWLPLEIKYDPKNGNIFGLLSAKINFNSILKE